MVSGAEQDVTQQLNNGDCIFEDIVDCSPLPCTISYTLYEEPAALALGMAENPYRFPSDLSIQYFEEKRSSYITVWRGEPEMPCDMSNVPDEFCRESTIINISVPALSDPCSNNCLDESYSCDDWIFIANEFSCDLLEAQYQCDCSGCGCGQAAATMSTTTTAECSWWNC